MPYGSPKRTARARWIFTRGMVFLLLGAIVNVAVAWNIGWFIDPATFGHWDFTQLPNSTEDNMSLSSVHGKSFSLWTVSRVKTPSACRVMSTWYDSATFFRTGRWFEGNPEELLPSWADALHPDHWRSIQNDHYGFAWAYGWPCYSMSGLVYQRNDPTNLPRGQKHFTYQTGCMIVQDSTTPLTPNNRQSTKLFVYRPIWSGFILNTLFYALVLGLLWYNPLRMRRWWRIHRGHCPRCAYDLRCHLDAGCPECGWNRAEHITS